MLLCPRFVVGGSVDLLSRYKFLSELARLPWIDAIWLYGSRARGDHTERSDIDLAIVAPRATEDEWFQVREIIDQADTLLHVDCVRFDRLSPDDKLAQKIIRDKKVLFERNPDAS